MKSVSEIDDRKKSNIKQEIINQCAIEKKSLSTKSKKSIPQSQIDLAPPFPFSFTSGLAHDFAEMHHEWESPFEFFFFSFLTIFGAFCRNIDVEDVPVGFDPPRLYVLLLGSTGVSRKSTAIDEAECFFTELYCENTPSFSRGVGSAEGLQRILSAEKNAGRTVMMVYDEFSSFVSKCQIQSSTLLPMVTTLFERTSYENTIKERDNRIENVHLALLAASTVETYHKTWTDNFTNIGFDNRLFLVPGRAVKTLSYPREIPYEKKSMLRAETLDVIRTVGNRKERLKWAINARNCFDEWYYKYKPSITRYGVRLDTYARRLLKIMTLNNKKSVIDIETTEQVLEIINWQLAVREAMMPLDVENKWARMEGNILRALRCHPTITESALGRMCNVGTYGSKVFMAGLENLLKMGVIGKRPGIRRDSTIWWVITE